VHPASMHVNNVQLRMQRVWKGGF